MTVNDVNTREKLAKENEWYHWGLRNVQINTGDPNAYTRFLSRSKDKNWFKTARGYLTSLKDQSANYIASGKVGKPWEINQMNDNIFVLEEMLSAWQSKKLLETRTQQQIISINDIALREKSALEKLKASKDFAFRKEGLTWSQRENSQRAWLKANPNHKYEERKKLNDSILSNPVNIEIREREEQVIRDIETQRLQQIKDQEITFNEQTNSGDFNETPITDVNVNSGCSECSGIVEKELSNNNMKFVGIAAIGLIGLMVVRK